MAKYISMDELNKFPIRINHRDEENGKLDFVLGIEVVFDYVESLPAADVVEVIRCKDCQVWASHSGFASHSPTGHCFYHDIDTLKGDFCSYGVRKERKNETL